jgi:surface protein
MSTISDKLNIINNAKESIKSSIEAKGVSVGDVSIAEYSSKIDQIVGNISNAKITDAYHLFYEGRRTDFLNPLLDLCENVKNTEGMFYECTKLTELDLQNFDMSNVTTANQMFYGCDKLTELDVSNFNTSNITDMTSMFYDCTKLTELNVSNFNTSNAKTMRQMFGHCELITELDVSNFNTNNVTDMASMFNRCRNLTELDVSNFNTSNVTDMTQLFYSCTKLTELDLRNFDMSKIIKQSDMFTSASELTNLKSFKNLGKGYVNKSNNYYNYNLSLSTSPKITKESLVDIITNGLYDLNLSYNVANGGTLYTQKLILGATNLAKLTAEEIAIATNKGWSVS